MSEANDVVVLPADVQDLIGKLQYEEEGEFPVERGYFWTSAASVENANPIFWDDAVADEITDGPVAPLIAAVGVVPPPPLGARAHGREAAAADPLRPEGALRAARGDHDREHTIFHEPVRPGDLITSAQRLVSVSEEQTRRLGTGRFWVIDVEYRNQRGELCGVERWDRLRLPENRLPGPA